MEPIREVDTPVELEGPSNWPQPSGRGIQRHLSTRLAKRRSSDEAVSPLLTESNEDNLARSLHNRQSQGYDPGADGHEDSDLGKPRQSYQSSFREHISMSPASPSFKGVFVHSPVPEKKHDLAAKITSWDPDPLPVRANKMWNPIWLRPLVVGSFAVLCVLLAVATGLMYFLSVAHDGLSVQAEVNHYAWKCGPVGVLILITYFWHMVDISTRSLMPWYCLRYGPGTASKTLLLDYISPNTAVIFKDSLVNGHFAVAATIAGKVLLVLATIFATGLLVLEPTRLTKNDDSSAPGVTFENRLHVETISMAVMCFCFALLAILSVVLFFTRPRNLVPAEPGSIAEMARIVESSPELKQRLSGLGHARLERIKRAIAGETFASRTSPESGHFLIDTVTSFEGNLVTELANPEANVNWWRPLASRNWFLAVIVVVTLAFIGVLEGIQQVSDKNDGLFDVVLGSARILSCYIPAAITLVLAAAFSSLRDVASIFAPFAALRQGSVHASKSVNVNYIARPGPKACLTAIKNGHVGLSLIFVANLLAALVTIVVSALYSIKQVQFLQPIKMEQLDSFFLDSKNISVDDRGAASMTSRLTYSNMSYPKWTFDDLVIPRLSAPRVGGLAGNLTETPAVIDIKVTATRARLNCTTLDTDARDLKIESSDSDLSGQRFPGEGNPYSRSKGKLLLHMNTGLPWSLCASKPHAQAKEARWNQYFYVINDTVANHVGKSTLLMWDDDGYTVYGDGIVATQQKDSLFEDEKEIKDIDTGGYGCPTFAVTLGSVSVSKTKSNKDDDNWIVEGNIATVVCWQEIQEVKATVRFSYPDLEIVGHPSVDENSDTTIESPTLRGTAYEFPVNNLLLSLNSSESQPHGSDLDDMGPFIKAIVWGRDDKSLEAISGEANAGALAEAANDLYARYMAQLISLNMRIEQPEGNEEKDDPRFRGQDASMAMEGTLSREGLSGRNRMVQNAPAKIALQVMLGLMTLCAVVARLMMRYYKVLPHNPCSIAGLGTLIVDGDMSGADEEPRQQLGVKKPTGGYAGLQTEDEDLHNQRQQGSQDGGKVFTMGWWKDDGDKWWFGIRGRAVMGDEFVLRERESAIFRMVSKDKS